MPVLNEIVPEPPARSKIIATLGPASARHDVLAGMVAAGVDVVRLNLSHGSHESHRAHLDLLAAVVVGAESPVAVLADLQGGKIRIGAVGPEGDGIDLSPGDRLVLATAEASRLDPGRATVSHRGLPDEVEAGDTVLLDDGRLRLRIEAVVDGEIRCRVVIGGRLLPHKGVNVPGRSISLPSLTPKDEADIAWLRENRVDMVALSFVRSGDDLRRVREMLAPATPLLIAKIERVDALRDFDDILAACDAVMIARGDLGLEIPIEGLPMVQKDLVCRTMAAGKPVIVATQMLESMREEPLPTRAEVADVANAILDGADAVMLSGETAVGRDPVGVVRMMGRIARQTELSIHLRARDAGDDTVDPVLLALADAAAAMVRRLPAATLAIDGRDQGLSRLITRRVPRADCIAGCIDAVQWRRLALDWGVRPLRLPQSDGQLDRTQLVAAVRGLEDISPSTPLVVVGSEWGVIFDQVAG